MESSVDRLAKMIVKADITDFIMAASIICSGAGQDGADLVAGYTRADFKRAIKRLRECQKQYPKYVAHYEEAIEHIRREWLHREVSVLP